MAPCCIQPWMGTLRVVVGMGLETWAIAWSHLSWVYSQENLVMNGLGPTHAVSKQAGPQLSVCPWLGPTTGHYLLAWAQPLRF